MLNESKIKDEIIFYSKLLFQNRLVAGNDGNLSIFDGEKIYITPTMRSKGLINQEELAITDLKGNILNNNKPSSEIKMHLKIYEYFPKGGAIIHAHPPFSTAYSLINDNLLDDIYLPEGFLFLGKIGIVPYATPSTEKVAKNFVPFLEDKITTFIMKNHGAVVYAENMEKAYYKIEQLEHYIKILTISKLMGRPKKLSKKDINDLIKRFEL